MTDPNYLTTAELEALSNGLGKLSEHIQSSALSDDISRIRDFVNDLLDIRMRRADSRAKQKGKSR